MSNDFISISEDNLSNVTGGKKEEPPPPPPNDDSGQYCKDGMDVHVEGTANGGVRTPVGVEVEGGGSFSYTKCK